MDGREPVQTTDYEYDEDGRLRRSICTSEPRWTEQDRAEVLAYEYYQSLFCPCGCGLKFEDTTSNEEKGPQFRASFITCRARMAVIDQQDEAAKAQSPYDRARLWSARKV